MKPLQFINIFLREPSEPRVTEEAFKEIESKSKDVYNLKWQVAVRRKFFGSKPFNRLN